jgi:hypothetical protein
MKTFHESFRIQSPYKIVVWVFALLWGCSIHAENRLHPVSVTLLNQNWGFPFMGRTQFRPLYPGLTIGIYRLCNDKLISFPQSVQSGFFYNNAAGSALFVHVDQGIRSRFKCGFFSEASLGIGYFHAFHPGDIYKRNSLDEYAKTTDFGKPSLMLSMSETIGFDLSQRYGIPIAPFIKGQWMVSYPYFDMVLPIRPSRIIHIGALIYF